MRISSRQILFRIHANKIIFKNSRWLLMRISSRQILFRIHANKIVADYTQF